MIQVVLRRVGLNGMLYAPLVALVSLYAPLTGVHSDVRYLVRRVEIEHIGNLSSPLNVHQYRLSLPR